METFERRHKNVPESTAPKAPPFTTPYVANVSKNFEASPSDVEIGPLATRQLREFNAGDGKQSNGRIAWAGNPAVLLSYAMQRHVLSDAVRSRTGVCTENLSELMA
jgi:hypothetical protein